MPDLREVFKERGHVLALDQLHAVEAGRALDAALFQVFADGENFDAFGLQALDICVRLCRVIDAGVADLSLRSPSPR